MSLANVKENSLNIRLNADLKEEVGCILKELGLNHSEAIRLFYRQVLLSRGIPFEVKLPSKSLMKSIEQYENNEIEFVDSVDDLFS